MPPQGWLTCGDDFGQVSNQPVSEGVRKLELSARTKTWPKDAPVQPPRFINNSEKLIGNAVVDDALPRAE